MAEGYRHTCLCESDRLGNDELYALVAGAVRHGRGEAQQLFATVTPLLSVSRLADRNRPLDPARQSWPSRR